MATPVLSFRVDDLLVRQLDHLAQATDRDRQYHLKRALSRYIDEESWHLKAIEEGIVDADAGNLTDMETIKRMWKARVETGSDR